MTTADAPFAAELELAFAAASEAAAILRVRSGSPSVREKGRADLVTEVDEAVERAIQEIIHERFPGDLFVAEEMSSNVRGAGRRWIVDPIDGTTNFVHGHPFACVSIAFAEESGPAAAVLDAPFLGEIYHAVRGGGAFLNGDRIAVSRTTEWSASLIGTGFPFKEGKGPSNVYFDLVEEIVATTHGVRRAGAAALDLAYVACGRLDAYFETGLSAWDLAAGVLLVEEAGGRISGWRGDREGPLDTGRILASNGHIHDMLNDRTGSFSPPL